MGSIVKTIGKAIKGIGKAIKKIAPVLLVAAVAYIGYGFMTGGGGWTQATDWGKSLMANASGGMPLSEAATSAQTFPLSGEGSLAGPGLISEFVPPTDPTLTPMGTPYEFEDTGGLLGTQPSTEVIPQDAMGVPDMATDTAGMISGMGDTAASVAEGGGLISGPRINNVFDAMKEEYDSTGLVPNFSKYLHTQDQLATITPTGDYLAAGPFDKVGDLLSDAGGAIKDFWEGPDWVPDWMKKKYYFGDQLEKMPTVFDMYGQDEFGINQQAANQVLSGTSDDLSFSDFPTGQMPDYTASNPGVFTYADDVGAPDSGGGMKSAANTIMSWGGKAWGLFKSALEKNPGMVLWSASKIIETIATLLDKSEEQQAYADSHVMGFAGQTNWDDLREKYGGIPGGPKSDFWKSADAGNQGRLTASSKVKTGTKPMGNTRMSAINNSPQGILGASKQGQV